MIKGLQQKVPQMLSLLEHCNLEQSFRTDHLPELSCSLSDIDVERYLCYGFMGWGHT